MTLPEYRKLAQEATELAAKATKGPWYVLAEKCKKYFPDKVTDYWIVLDPNANHKDGFDYVVRFDYIGSEDKENAELISASRTLVPQLSSAVEALCKEVENKDQILEMHKDRLTILKERDRLKAALEHAKSGYRSYVRATNKGITADDGRAVVEEYCEELDQEIQAITNPEGKS